MTRSSRPTTASLMDENNRELATAAKLTGASMLSLELLAGINKSIRLSQNGVQVHFPDDTYH